MNKIKKLLITILIYVSIITIILLFLIFKSYTYTKKTSKVVEATLEYVSKVYPEKEFAFGQINFLRDSQSYTVILVDKNSSNKHLYCRVKPYGDDYDVFVIGGKNIDI